MKTLTEKKLKDQGMRRCKHASNYFLGAFEKYGRYQWDVKFYGFEADWEVETAQQWVLGDYMHSKGEFEYLSEVVGRPVKASLQGRSGGWLVIDTELTKAELRKVDKYINASLKALPKFLKEERKLRAAKELADGATATDSPSKTK